MKPTVAILIMGLSAASPTDAQDVDAMAKWTAATVVRYRVVGEFSGATTILTGKRWSASGQVTDRVEIDFDWDQVEMKLVGKPVIRNFPTKVGKIGVGLGCPPTKVDGPVEFATVTAVEEHPILKMSGMLVLKSNRSQPAGSTCFTPPDSGIPDWEVVPARSVSADISFMVGQPMMLFIPGQTTPDGKSLVVKGENWTWTQAPTIVR